MSPQSPSQTRDSIRAPNRPINPLSIPSHPIISHLTSCLRNTQRITMSSHYTLQTFAHQIEPKLTHLSAISTEPIVEGHPREGGLHTPQVIGAIATSAYCQHSLRRRGDATHLGHRNNKRGGTGQYCWGRKENGGDMRGKEKTRGFSVEYLQLI